MTGRSAGSGGPRRVEVVIDELVLHGFDSRHATAIADAVRTGLAGALAGWTPARATTATHVEAGDVTLPAAAAPAAVGSGVGRQVGRALTGDPAAATAGGVRS